jgi:ATP-dependent helicase IRC3
MPRSYAEEHLPLFDDQLRPYQREGILKIRSSFARGHKAVMAVLPTGMGKTRLFTVLPRDGARVLVICPQIELVRQTSDTIRALRRRVAGLEQASLRWDGEDWAVACYASLIAEGRYKKFLGKIDLVIVDECDDKFSKKFRDMMQDFIANGARVLGVTATPFRGGKNESALFGFYEDVPFCLELRDALDQHWLVRPKVYVHRVKSVDFSSLSKTKTDFSPAELDALLTKEQCLHDIAALVNQHHKRSHGVVFCASVLQAKALRDLLVTRHGKKVSCVWGTQNEDERNDEIKKFKSGENSLIVNCNVLGRGVDIPEINEIFNARPTKSKARYLQAIGRGLRTLGGVLANAMTLEERKAAIAASAKPDFVIHDITNTCEFHQPIVAIDVLLAGPKEIIDKIKEDQQDAEEPATIEELDADLAEEIEAHKEMERLAKEAEKKRRAELIVGVTFDSRQRDLFDPATAKRPNVRTYRAIFGKWKGYPLNSPLIPDSYLEWAIEKARLTPFWFRVYQQELERRQEMKRYGA